MASKLAHYITAFFTLPVLRRMHLNKDVTRHQASVTAAMHVLMPIAVYGPCRLLIINSAVFGKYLPHSYRYTYHSWGCPCTQTGMASCPNLVSSCPSLCRQCNYSLHSKRSKHSKLTCQHLSKQWSRHNRSGSIPQQVHLHRWDTPTPGMNALHLVDIGAWLLSKKVWQRSYLQLPKLQRAHSVYVSV
jgi:hypothetical protein